MRWLTILVISILLVVYMMVGAAIFMALEQDNETTTSNDIRSRVNQFLNENTCLTTAELETFITALIQAYDAGVIATNQTSSASNWNYASSIFFAMTVITTIGYGNISPTTSGGQVFCVFFAVFGIPITAVLLAGVGEKLRIPIKKLRQKKLFPKYEKAESIVKITLIVVIGAVLFSLIPAAIFYAVEDWTYLEAWYYTVITMTTVGFGDFVPGQEDADYRGIYKIMTGFWIFISLAWLAMLLGIAQEALKAETKKIEDQAKVKAKTKKNADKTSEDNTDSAIVANDLEKDGK